MTAKQVVAAGAQLLSLDPSLLRADEARALFQRSQPVLLGLLGLRSKYIAGLRDVLDANHALESQLGDARDQIWALHESNAGARQAVDHYLHGAGGEPPAGGFGAAGAPPRAAQPPPQQPPAWRAAGRADGGSVRELQAEMAKLESAALKLQRVWRGKLARARLLELCDALMAA